MKTYSILGGRTYFLESFYWISMNVRRKVTDAEEQLARVRRACATLPETIEKVSHGEPTFFVRKKVYVMFANNHHNAGHIAIWLPVPSGSQEALVQTWPSTFFVPPYVGVKGWVGIELDQIGDEDLAGRIAQAWRLIGAKKRQSG